MIITPPSGGSGINHVTELWCAQESLPFTRSRGHRKNDNCFVEQKPDYSTLTNKH
jgi:hypothetical protein